LDPFFDPTSSPSLKPTKDPSKMITISPSFIPTFTPSLPPSHLPTRLPSHAPSLNPTLNPSMDPTFIPSLPPTHFPTRFPSYTPSLIPTLRPTMEPTLNPTNKSQVCRFVELCKNCKCDDETVFASGLRGMTVGRCVDFFATSEALSGYVSGYVSARNRSCVFSAACPEDQRIHDTTFEWSLYAYMCPTDSPTEDPTLDPTVPIPSLTPTLEPTLQPSTDPTLNPSSSPSLNPTMDPTDLCPEWCFTSTALNKCEFIQCSLCLTCAPSPGPTLRPSDRPTFGPSSEPTENPSLISSKSPSTEPSLDPTIRGCQGDEAPSFVVDFASATVLHANLGGMGNQDDPEEIYYQGVAFDDGRRINLRVTTDDTYACKDQGCTLVEFIGFGVINVQSALSINVRFDFVYDDDTPVYAALLYMTFFDIDGGSDGVERVRLENIDSYITPPTPAMDITSGIDWVEVSNNFTLAGENVENPRDLENFTTEHQSVSITASWRDVNGFNAILSMNPDWPTAARSFMFSGISPLLNVCARCETSGLCSWRYVDPELLCNDGITDDCESMCECIPGPTHEPTVDPTYTPTLAPLEDIECRYTEVCTFCKCNSATRISDGIFGTTLESCSTHYYHSGDAAGFFSIREDSCVYSSSCPESERVDTDLDWTLYEFICAPILPTYQPTLHPSISPTTIPTVAPTFDPTTLPTQNPISPSFSPTQSPTQEPSTEPSLIVIPPECSFTELCSFCKCNEDTNFADGMNFGMVESCIGFHHRYNELEGFLSMRDTSCVFSQSCPESERVSTDLAWSLHQYECSGTRNPTTEPSRLPTLQPTTLSPTVQPSLSLLSIPSLSPTHLPTTNPSFLPTYIPTTDPSPIIIPPECSFRELCSFCKCNEGTLFVDGTNFGMVDSCVGFHYRNTSDVGFLSMRDTSCVYSSACPENGRISTELPWSLYEYNCIETFNPTIYPSTEPTLSPIVQITLSPTSNPTLTLTASPTTNPNCADWCIANLESWETKCDLPPCEQCDQCLNSLPTHLPSIHPTSHPTSHTMSPSGTPTRTPTQLPTFTPSKSPTVTPTYIPASDLGCTYEEVCSFCKCNSDTRIVDGIRGMDADSCVVTYSDQSPNGFLSIREDACVYSSSCPNNEIVTTDFSWSLYSYSCGSVSPSSLPSSIPTRIPTLIPSATPTIPPSYSPTAIPTPSPTLDPTIETSCEAWCGNNFNSWDIKCSTFPKCAACTECSSDTSTSTDSLSKALSPGPAEMDCHTWCASNTQPWHVKCTFVECGACKGCAIVSSPTTEPTISQSSNSRSLHSEQNSDGRRLLRNKCTSVLQCSDCRCGEPYIIIGEGIQSMRDCSKKALARGQTHFSFRTDSSSCIIPRDSITQCVTNRVNDTGDPWDTYELHCNS